MQRSLYLERKRKHPITQYYFLYFNFAFVYIPGKWYEDISSASPNQSIHYKNAWKVLISARGMISSFLRKSTTSVETTTSTSNAIEIPEELQSCLKSTVTQLLPFIISGTISPIAVRETLRNWLLGEEGVKETKPPAPVSAPVSAPAGDVSSKVTSSASMTTTKGDGESKPSDEMGDIVVGMTAMTDPPSSTTNPNLGDRDSAAADNNTLKLKQMVINQLDHYLWILPQYLQYKAWRLVKVSLSTATSTSSSSVSSMRGGSRGVATLSNSGSGNGKLSTAAGKMKSEPTSMRAPNSFDWSTLLVPKSSAALTHGGATNSGLKVVKKVCCYHSNVMCILY